jgi:hypothetical protein
MAENSTIYTETADRGTDLSRDEVVQDNRKSSYKCLCNCTRTSLQRKCQKSMHYSELIAKE